MGLFATSSGLFVIGVASFLPFAFLKRVESINEVKRPICLHHLASITKFSKRNCNRGRSKGKVGLE